MRNKLQIAVFGSDGDHCTKKSSKDIQQLTELSTKKKRMNLLFKIMIYF